MRVQFAITLSIDNALEFDKITKAKGLEKSATVESLITKWIKENK